MLHCTSTGTVTTGTISWLVTTYYNLYVILFSVYRTYICTQLLHKLRHPNFTAGKFVSKHCLIEIKIFYCIEYQDEK